MQLAAANRVRFGSAVYRHRVAFAAAIFVNAALLFALEPMFGKLALPKLGGGAAVWTTCLLFFQVALLTGYLYAHAVARLLSGRAQVRVHVALLVVAGFTLPLSVPANWSPRDVADPTPALLWLLAAHVGPVFLLLAAGSPLLQAWSVRSEDRRDVYRLYAASNVGSMAALLAYPVVVEPELGLRSQAIVWTFAYAGLVVLMVACGRGVSSPIAQPRLARGRPIDTAIRLRWIALAAVPSSLLLGVTTHITTDIAPVPLLWVVPLALYLLTFVIAFGSPSERVARLQGRVAPFALIAVVSLLFLHSELPGLFGAIPHLVAFFLLALGCHMALARTRPEPALLTEFYLWIALGGALGGLFNAIVAPIAFTSVVEYPLAIVGAILLGGASGATRRAPLVASVATVSAAAVVALLLAASGGVSLGLVAPYALLVALVIVAYSQRHDGFRFALAVGALLAVGTRMSAYDGRTIRTARSFYGAYRIVDDSAGGIRRLYSGNTVHGSERLRELERHYPPAPLAYYHADGPLGSIFARRAESAPWRVEAIGLGAGAAASYAVPGDSWVFYEIDPLVASIASDRRDFTYIASARARPAIVLGDARVSLSAAAPVRDNLIIVDAFSSDAVPIHLLTREALSLYRSRLAPDGIIAWHVSNKYLALWRVLAALSTDAHLTALVNTDVDVPSDASGRLPSIWVVMTPSAEQGSRLRVDPRWHPLETPKPILWTDDFSNVASILR